MKRIFLFLVVSLFIISCKKEICVSCIAESDNGKIVNYVMECDNNRKYINGYVTGFNTYYKEHGDTVTVHCIYK